MFYDANIGKDGEKGRTWIIIGGFLLTSDFTDFTDFWFVRLLVSASVKSDVNKKALLSSRTTELNGKFEVLYYQ